MNKYRVNMIVQGEVLWLADFTNKFDAEDFARRKIESMEHDDRVGFQIVKAELWQEAENEKEQDAQPMVENQG